MLSAYQIEWNKLNHLLMNVTDEMLAWLTLGKDQHVMEITNLLQISIEELRRLETIWGDQFIPMIQRIRDQTMDLEVQLFSGSLNEYRRATRYWWENIETRFPDILNRPVYFISSNTHSIPNLLTGFALTQQERLSNFLHTAGNENLLAEWHDINHDETPARPENFLYYILKKYQATAKGHDLLQAQDSYEQNNGVYRFPASTPSMLKHKSSN